jgi:general stress protein 26
MKLVYSGGFTNDIAVVLEGQATLVEDKRLRNILWRDRWGSFTNKNDYVLVKFETLAARVVSPAAHTVASIVRSPEKAWCRS